MFIDVHAHAQSRDMLDRWAKRGEFNLQIDDEGMVLIPGLGQLNPVFYDHEPRFERMEEMGVDRMFIAPWTSFTSRPGGAADAELTREINQSTADCVASSGGKFTGMAALALGEPDQAVEELRRALDEHGFVGAFTATYAGDRPLDHASLLPLWEELGNLGIPVIVHPMNAEPNLRWTTFTNTTSLNWPNETTLAVSRLIFSGVVERNPGLRLLLVHGGGALPFLRGRLDLAYSAPNYEKNPDCSAHISKPPSEYLDRFLYDTAVGAPESLDFLISLVGAERVVFGTDDPFEIADTGGTMALPALQKRPEQEREMILGGTISALLGW
ncbi:MAG: amidohydrolase family protein [Solirubrobacterales bacterium]